MAAAFKVRFLRGSAAANAAHIAPDGAITIDTDNRRMRLHDGVTPGGKEVPNTDDVQSAISDALAGFEGGTGGGAVDSVNGQTGVIVLTKADIGLDAVDNFPTATNVEAEAGTSNSHFMTPATVAAFMGAMGFTQEGDEWVMDQGTIAP